jgi:hypothetical protein
MPWVGSVTVATVNVHGSLEKGYAIPSTGEHHDAAGSGKPQLVEKVRELFER